MSNLNGMLLGDRYEIVELIGVGGMAMVYKGRDKILNRMVAIKILKPEFNADEDFVKKFETESQSAASLSHPNIVNVFDVGYDHEMNYIVMELITGNTLREYLNKMNGFMKEEAVINIVLQVASALHHAHQNNIVHRDIKSQNILVSDNGSVKVADFGIARATTKGTIVNTKEVVGSVHYASPEQARGGFVDARSDIYSLGILMYELITKELPFDGETPVSIALQQIKDSLPDPRTINAEVTDGFVSILQKATQKDLSERYQSIYDLLEDLKKLRVDRSFVVDDHIYLHDQTIVLPKITEEEIMNHQTQKRQAPPQNGRKMPPKKKKSNHLNIVITILAAFIIAVAIFGIMAFNQFREIFDVKVVNVPDVVGKQVEEAIREIDDVGLVADATERRFSKTVAEGNVISQNYESGEELKEGFTVKLVVSNGPQQYTVPNTVHQTYAQAEVMIENEHFEVGQVEQKFDDLPSGTVIEQTPKGGVQAGEGTSINLVISQGPEIKTVLVPNVANKTLAEAENELNRLGLQIGSIEYELSDTVEKGSVISNAKVGDEVNQGTEVDIVLANGPETLPGDDTGDGTGTGDADDGTGDGSDNTGDNGGTTDPNGQVGQSSDVTLAFYVSTFTHDPEQIKVVLVQNGSSTVVYESTHKVEDGDFSIKVRGSGSAVIEVYYTDQLVSQQTVEF